ncbi:hypothetical protein N0V90_009120 [Kalmusia sp. IMI 367209]|nr:hypothetical protein N0V90_009120 [Kalmusia sp. IMI 367209]
MSNIYNTTLLQLVRGLENLAGILHKAETHAQSHSIDPSSYTTASLHPDMKDLRFQVYRATTDPLRYLCGIFASLDPPHFPEEETSFPDLRARIAKVIAYLKSLDVSVFDGKDDEVVVLRPPRGTAGVEEQLVMTWRGAADYIGNMVLPGFWFHVSTAYGILRMKGVPLDKIDFLNAAKNMDVTVES